MAFVYTGSLQEWLGSGNEAHDRKLKWVVGRQTHLSCGIRHSPAGQAGH